MQLRDILTAMDTAPYGTRLEVVDDVEKLVRGGRIDPRDPRALGNSEIPDETARRLLARLRGDVGTAATETIET